MTETQTAEFGKWQKLLWPIHNFELKKFLPMFFMMFFISFNYTILRDTKDTLIVTAAGSGAEAIPYLKVWVVIPSAIIFTLLYTKMSNALTRENLFYVTLIPFIIFFALFAMVIYPNKDLLHPVVSADALQAMLPKGMMGFVAIYRNWTYSLFYVMAELWGSVALSLLFWTFANEITRVKEAKRFYTRFILGANVALLFSGPAIVRVANIRSKLPPEVDAWGVSLNYLMGMVVFGGLAVIALYWWMNRSVLPDPRFYDPADLKKSKKKAKLTLKESLGFLLKSKYLRYLCLIVMAYGVSINLVEVTWKGQLKLQYPNPNDYATFMGYFSTFTGAATILMVMFIGPWSLMTRSWGFSASVTPIVLIATGTIFFGFTLFGGALGGLMTFISTTPLWIAVFVGASQNILSKSSKYSLFDPTKEMAYIPLDQESKVKGKAAIDVVGARLGKSGGALINQGLLVAFGTLAAITPYVAVILFFVIGAWLFAIRWLNVQFNILTKNKDEAESNEKTEQQATT